jgi:sigma-B regulation protein RsbU (phosphoserine phosphatase)
LDPGGSLLLYTDGVTEAEDGAGEQFGTERLAAGLQAAGQGDPERTCEQLWSLLKAYQGSVPQDDDVTLVAVEVDTNAARSG